MISRIMKVEVSVISRSLWLCGEERCVTILKTAARETTVRMTNQSNYSLNE